MNTTEMILCKAVATEVFPDRGWIGVVGPDATGQQRLLTLYTRPELYREVSKIMLQNGEDNVRQAVHRFRVPDQYQLMFASVKDALDGTHARKLIESHLHD